MSRQVGELEALGWLHEAASEEPAISADVEARLWTRVTSTVGALAVGQLGVATTVGDPTGLSSGTWRRVVASRLAIWSAPALVVGAASGVVGHAALTKENAHIVYVDRIVAPPKEDPAVSVESLALELAVAEAPKPPKSSGANTPLLVADVNSVPSASSVARGEGGLVRERTLLDPARAALSAGEPANALERIARHAKEFPNGILSEEREAIAINALVSLGSYAQATKRATTFRARYPHSLMTHVVDAAMAAVPKE
jgi:hypothetical protein